MIKARFVIGCLITMGLSSPVLSAGDLQTEELSYGCIGCHGENAEGVEELGAPRLAGQSQGYLLEQTVNFRKGRRGYAVEDARGTEMRVSVETLTDHEIGALSAYFSEREVPLTAIAGTAGDLEAGKKLYNETCASCHGFKGLGSAAVMAPNLAILGPWYIRDQMAAYQKGWRGGDESTTRAKYMRSIARQVTTPKQLDDIIAYISSLRSKS